MGQSTLQVLPLLEWPSADIVRHNMPQTFKLSFPSTRVIIDYSEIYIQIPRSVDAQRSTYSSYKSHNTFKFLLGIAPSVQITYLSTLFVGSISDREIVKKVVSLNWLNGETMSWLIVVSTFVAYCYVKTPSWIFQHFLMVNSYLVMQLENQGKLPV